MGPGESARVSVAVRVRPLAAKERLAGSDSSIFVHEDGSTLTANPGRSFVFDRVCGEDTPQAELHTELVKPMISRCIDGYNCTVLAYGQTGSGKTHTMTGTMVETDNPFVDDLGGQEGTIPRTVVQLMSNLELVYSNIIKFNSDAFHEVYVSFIELYQEEIVDLLNPSQTRTRGGLAIREDGLGGVCVAGATEERVQNASDILELLRKGTLCRTTKSTDMNLASSRSHAIFTLMIRQRRPASFSYEKFCSDNNPMFDHEINSPHSKGCENVPGNTESQLPSNCDDNNSSFSSSEVLKSITSKLHFVDLAGSERLKRTNAIGVRAKESISINSGLLALGNVISALASMEDDLVRHGRKPHVPYRDSKLTRLLQDSLGGNSHTLMIACVSPASEDIPETVNTLRYASRARAIKNHAAVNEDAGGVAAFEVLQLRRQVAALRQELLQIRGMGRRITCPPQSSVPGTPRQIGASLQHQEASDAELIRLRASNRELTRRVESLTREKISIEAERDYFKSNPAPNLKRANSEIPVIKQHLSTIQELKARVTDLELRLVDRPLSGTSHGVSSFTSNVITGGHLKAPKEPGTPAWIAKATAAIEKTRSEIQASVPLAAEAQRLQAQGAEPSKVASLLTRVISDVSVKEDLIVQLETAQREALFMRQKYDERHTLALERLSAATLERDEALALVATLRSSKSTIGYAPLNTNTQRNRYEERIKQLCRELAETKERLAEVHRDGNTRGLASDTITRNLKATVTQLRTEKTRLQSKLDEVLAKTTNTNLNEEIRELKNRERKALESSKRFKKAYDFQRTLLNRKAEQYMLARARAKHLATLIRRHRIPLSPSAARLLADDAFLDIENPLDDISCIDGMMSTTAIVADNCSDDDSESDVDDNRGENDVSITKIDPDGDQQKNVPQKRTTKNNSIITKIYTSLQENDSNPKFISSDDKLDHGNICSTSLENSNSYNYDLMIQDTDDIGHSPSRRSKKPLLTGSNFLFGTSSGNSLRIVPLAPLGTDVPRSVLRMSPLIPRRKDVFARLADSASLNLASQNVNLDSDDIFESRRASIDYKRSSSLPENSKLYENNYICNFVGEKKLGSVSNSDQLISSAPNYCGMGKPDTPLNYDEEPTFERSQHLELKTSEVELFVESVNSDRILNKNEARHVRIMGTTMNPTKSSFSGGLDASSQEPVIEATNLEKSFAPPSYPMDVDEY